MRIATRSVNFVFPSMAIRLRIRHQKLRCFISSMHRTSALSVMLRITSRSAVRLMTSFNISPSLVQARLLCAVAVCRMDSLATRQQRNLYFFFLRKEVIQPHLPIRLPCYDFTPVTRPAFGSSLLSVGSLTSGITNSHGVTGGVYKTRERIHRDILIRDY